MDLARQDGGTALFKAAHKGHLDLVTELISHGASQELLKVRKKDLSLPFFANNLTHLETDLQKKNPRYYNRISFREIKFRYFANFAIFAETCDLLTRKIKPTRNF